MHTSNLQTDFIKPLDGTLIDTTTLGQSWPANNDDDDDVLHTPQISRIRAKLSDAI